MSSLSLIIGPILSLFFAAVGPAAFAQDSKQNMAPRKGSAEETRVVDPAEVFRHGQIALARGNLKDAQEAFLTVARIDPHSAPAYANLGVVYMREKQWNAALSALQKAERLDPAMTGIRLNIGLAYFRQNRFSEAIPPFASVVREDPGSAQARYLLGLCYFLTQKYADAVNALEPLQAAQSRDLMFLYVLAIAAWKAKQPGIEQSAMTRLIEVGGNSPEFHLFMGKAHLNRDEYDEAIKEFEVANQTAPRLPFLHFNLGRAYLKKRDLDHARAEFLEDARIEPDVAYNYDQLGMIAFEQEHPEQAEQYFRRALRLDPKLANSHYQLARVYKDKGEDAKALSEADSAAQLAPQNASVHYLRGRILLALGRKQDAEQENAKVHSISDAELKHDQQVLENSGADPELIQPSEP